MALRTRWYVKTKWAWSLQLYFKSENSNDISQNENFVSVIPIYRKTIQQLFSKNFRQKTEEEQSIIMNVDGNELEKTEEDESFIMNVEENENE